MSKILHATGTAGKPAVAPGEWMILGATAGLSSNARLRIVKTFGRCQFVANIHGFLDVGRTLLASQQGHPREGFNPPGRGQ
jgi:hypothetical protein